MFWVRLLYISVLVVSGFSNALGCGLGLRVLFVGPNWVQFGLGVRYMVSFPIGPAGWVGHFVWV